MDGFSNYNIDVDSTTPEGSPAPGLNPLAGLQPSANAAAGASAAPDTSSILKALADMAKQNPAAPAATTAVPAPANPLNLLNMQNTQTATPTFPPVPSSSVDQAAQPAAGSNVNPYGNAFGALGNLANGMPPAANTLPGAQPNPLAAVLPQQAAAGPQQALTPDVLQQVQLLQLLAAQGIPQDQWATALQILSLSNNTNAGAAGGLPNLNAAQGGFNMPDLSGQQGWPGHGDGDRGRDRDYMRSPPGQYRRRSGSPGWDRRREASPPRRRDSPVYGEYLGDSPGRRGGGRRGNDYRQRSPPGRRRRTPSPPRKDASLPPPGPKLVEWDYSIGQGNIKVLSRTLFVGGVTYVSCLSFIVSWCNILTDSYFSSSEAHLRSLFNQFGVVQTCIVNVDKRHAFIKMINRRDAMNAREGMETYKSGDMQLRVSVLSMLMLEMDGVVY